MTASSLPSLLIQYFPSATHLDNHTCVSTLFLCFTTNHLTGDWTLNLLPLQAHVLQAGAGKVADNRHWLFPQTQQWLRLWFRFFHEAWRISDINVGSLLYFKIANTRTSAHSCAPAAHSWAWVRPFRWLWKWLLPPSWKRCSREQLSGHTCFALLSCQDHTEQREFPSVLLKHLLWWRLAASQCTLKPVWLRVGPWYIWTTSCPVHWCFKGVYSRLQQTLWVMKNWNGAFNVCKGSGSLFLDTKLPKMLH